MVWSKTCVLKIDRPAGIVKFGKREDTKDRLNKFEKNKKKHRHLVEKSMEIMKNLHPHSIILFVFGFFRWSSSITDLLDLVDTCTHLIEKEKMMQQARTKMKAVAA